LLAVGLLLVAEGRYEKARSEKGWFAKRKLPAVSGSSASLEEFYGFANLQRRADCLAAVGALG